MVMAPAAAPVQPGIHLRGLAKSFRTPHGPVHAVRGVDVSIEPGETVALLGPNGAGKSTTIDMLLGLLAPDAGTVELFGGAPADAIAAGRVGAMLQTGALLREVTVRELLEMMASLYPRSLAVAEVLDLCGLEAMADHRTEKLSGGETQRVRFACALVSNPDLLVLDEPTVAMDVEGRRAFWTTMRGFASRGTTIVFATHYLEEADAIADRVVVIDHGTVIADDTASRLKAGLGDLVTLGFETEADAATAAWQADVVLGTGAEVERAGTVVRVRAPHGAETAPGLVTELAWQGVPVTRLEVASATLDDVFLELTGRSLRESNENSTPTDTEEETAA
jgi:ABC-2 type transport system ATP-binding protein